MNDYTWQKVSAALSAMEKQERLFSEIIDKIGAAYDSPIANPFFSLQGELVNALERECGDKTGWIYYFIYENNYGKNALEARFNDRKIRLINHDDLRRVIELTNV